MPAKPDHRPTGPSVSSYRDIDFFYKHRSTNSVIIMYSLSSLYRLQVISLGTLSFDA